MRIQRIELRRYRIPFRKTFVHASAARSEGDAILVQVDFEGGLTGFGEIQARPYVTGEDTDSIWGRHALALAEDVLGKRVRTAREVEATLGGPDAYERAPALVGGFDLALMDGLDAGGKLDWVSILGPNRTGPVLRCITLGSDISAQELRRAGRLTRLMGHDVVKLKVTGPDDIVRIRVLREAAGDEVRIRLDANGRLSPDEALELLGSISDADVESVEEPLPRDLPDLTERLLELHRRTGISLMADESMCTPSDVDRFARSGAYQVANVRVGKCGGVSGTRRFLSAVRRAGLGLVSGTMVGETPILLHFSVMLLQHCDELAYVEGIDQAEKLLVAPVVRPAAPGSGRRLEWDRRAEEEYCVSRREIC